MTVQHDPYVRVFYSILEDPRFVSLSVGALGAWLKLRILADGLYPSAAPVPRWAPDELVNELAGAGLIALLPGDVFRMPDLDAERATRAELQAKAGTERARSATRSPDGKFSTTANPMRRGSATPPASAGDPGAPSRAGAGATGRGGPAPAGVASSVHPAVAGAGPSRGSLADGPAASLSDPLRSAPNISTPTPGPATQAAGDEAQADPASVEAGPGRTEWDELGRMFRGNRPQGATRPPGRGRPDPRIR